MKEIDKVALIKIDDGKILSTKSKGKIKYYIPGGKREVGESDEETLIREISEELSVEVLPKSMRFIGTFRAQADGHEKGIFVKMTCYQADYSGTLKVDSEVEEIKWLSYKDIDSVSEVDKVIFNFLRVKGDLK